MPNNTGPKGVRSCPNCGAEVTPETTNCGKCWRPLPFGPGIGASRNEPGATDSSSEGFLDAPLGHAPSPSSDEYQAPTASLSSAPARKTHADTPQNRLLHLRGGDENNEPPAKGTKERVSQITPTRGWLAISATMVGGVLVAIGTTLPWQSLVLGSDIGVQQPNSYRIFGTNANTMIDEGRNILVGGLAVVLMALVVAIICRRRSRGSRFPAISPVVSFACLAIAAATAIQIIVDYTTVTAPINALNGADLQGHGSLGDGFWVCLLGACVAMCGAGYLLWTRVHVDRPA